MGHVVLLGDSIFDNARYVSGHPAVIDQVRRSLPKDWTASLLAVDGHMTEDVSRQLPRVPKDCTHLFVSIGGNDALGESGIFREAASTVGDAMGLLSEVQARFKMGYHEMLQAVLALGKPTAICTIYDAVPGLEPAEVVALAAFNDVILRSAISAGLPAIDLRQVCCNRDDYSSLSPIEPSHLGGAKIARAIALVATTHDFARDQTVIYH